MESHTVNLFQCGLAELSFFQNVVHEEAVIFSSFVFHSWVFNVQAHFVFCQKLGEILEPHAVRVVNVFLWGFENWLGKTKGALKPMKGCQNVFVDVSGWASNVFHQVFQF